MKIVGAVDIGSNAMRCAVGVIEKGKLKVLKTQRSMVGLGRSVFTNKDKMISKESIEASKVVFKEFKDIFDIFNVEQIKAVGTSALRDAVNADVLVKCANQFDIPLEVISGEEEAKLIRIAVQEKVDIQNYLAAMLDIGGGSVEFTVVDKGKTIFSISEKLGTIRLLQSLSANSTDRFSRRVEKVVESWAIKIEQNLAASKLEILIATGGNMEELGRVRVQIFKEKKNSNKIRFEELERIIDIIEPLTLLERQTQFGFRPDRADVILPAAIVLREVMRRSKMKKAIIPGVGLKEGILVSLLKDEL